MPKQVYFDIKGQRYPMPDFNELTGREAGLVKTAFGITTGKLQQALEDGDSDALLGLVAVAVLRADGQVDTEALKDVPLRLIQVIEEGEDSDEDDAAGDDSPQPAGADAGA